MGVYDARIRDGRPSSPLPRGSPSGLILAAALHASAHRAFL